MIAPIAEMLRTYIQTLNFADRVGGLARATKVKIRNGENMITKTIPMVKDDFDDCEGGKMIPILPDIHYKSVHFFEDGGGIEIVDQDSYYLHCEARLTLISWYNLRDINAALDDCNLCTAQILAVIPYRLPNSGYYTVIRVEPTGELQKGWAVFNKYTLDDEKDQFSTLPEFDSTAIDWIVSYWFPVNCVESEDLTSSLCI